MGRAIAKSSFSRFSLYGEKGFGHRKADCPLAGHPAKPGPHLSGPHPWFVAILAQGTQKGDAHVAARFCFLCRFDPRRGHPLKLEIPRRLARRVALRSFSYCARGGCCIRRETINEAAFPLEGPRGTPTGPRAHAGHLRAAPTGAKIGANLIPVAFFAVAY